MITDVLKLFAFVLVLLNVLEPEVPDEVVVIAPLEPMLVTNPIAAEVVHDAVAELAFVLQLTDME
jgi:hypothetical protein